VKLSFDPSWSLVFDGGVCVSALWLAGALARRRPFRALGTRGMLAGSAVLCVPLLYFGRVFSLVVSLVTVPWLAYESYHDTEQPLPVRPRALLTVARILVFLLVILCLLRPRLVFEQIVTKPAVAVVLADVSSSMDGEDCPPHKTRFAALRRILEDNRRSIDDIKKVCDYRFATFAEMFQRADGLPESPGGSRTKLSDAFAGVGKDLGGAKAAGIVLLTDGRDNGLGDPRGAARRLGVPVFAVCLGEAKGSSDFADSSIQNVDCAERVFLKNVAVVTVRVAYDGPEVNTPVKVTLKVYDDKGKELLDEAVPSKGIPMPKPVKTEDVEFKYIPKTVGIKKLVVHVTPADKDANVRNNTKELYVRASESALKVLLIEGEVRWEYKFLRRAVAGAENIELICVNAFLAGEAESEKLLPKDEEEWGELSLLVLGDIPARRFKPAQLDRIRRFVAEGGSLLMLGGFATLGPGGYGPTPVAKTLPVDVRASDTQTLEAVKVVPTSEGLEHKILTFGKTEATQEVWDSLPPISGYSKVTGVKPLAKVLVKSPGGDPILAIQEYEKGRTAVFAADTTWRWIFNKGQFARYHKAFWRQLVQWLTKSGYGGVEGGIWCETDRLSYLTGDTPVLTVRAGGKRVEKARIAAVITGPGMKLNMPIGEGAGQYVLGLPETVSTSGGYEVRVTATLQPSTDPKAPKELTAQSKFVVQELDIENENPGADPKLLEAIAQATDGAVFDREEAHRAFDKIVERRIGARIPIKKYQRLWDNLYMYVALGALLCVEWVVRKRKGLA